MNSFTFSMIFAERELPGGIEDILRTHVSGLTPPRWADGIRLVSWDSTVPNGLLMVVNGPLSPNMRRAYFSCFRHRVPVCCMYHSPAPEDSIVKDLQNKELCWSFNSAAEGREVISRNVQEWLDGLNRESLPFPQGRELLDSYGRLQGLSVDSASLDAAREVLARRGFVCLSGSIGAGKTSIARILLSEAWEQGLNPVEIIARDLDPGEVVRLLTGPEDCAVFLDIDSLRRIVGIYPARLWSMVLSLMIRATESRHRLILATSTEDISDLFVQHDDAHVILPEPSARRRWRLDEGKQALKWFKGMDSMEKAELLLLAAFDPVVPEAVFKRVLFRLLDRLMIQEKNSFPSSRQLEEIYSVSLAARDMDPFRRIRDRGEVYLAVSDSVKMWAIDQGIRELLQEDAPFIRAFTDTLIGSEEASIRRAGFFLAGFYGSLSDEVKAKLLLHIASERSAMNLIDVLNMLLSSKEQVDDSIVSMCRKMMQSSSAEVRGAVAGTLGRGWIMESEEFRDTVMKAAGDDEASVRGRLLADLTMWGLTKAGERIYRRFLKDEAPPVRRSLMLYIGSKFPRLDKTEYKVLNEVLENGDPQLITALIFGLLDRRLEEFNQEFNDLLWVLMDRLPPGGKGRLAWRIGARLRFFSREVRNSLRTDLSEQDILRVARCWLMNYSSLFPEEKESLRELTADRISLDRHYASMILRYYSIMDDELRGEFLREVLESDRYHGREALSQLICVGRQDLTEAAVNIVQEIIRDDEFEKRAALPFFILWNRRELGEVSLELLSDFAGDDSPYVRRALVKAIRLLGDRSKEAEFILKRLTDDDERAVRASVAVTLGEFQGPGEDCDPQLLQLLRDSDPFVRQRGLSGLMENVDVSVPNLVGRLMEALDDSAPEVRLEALKGLMVRPALCREERIDEKVADRIADPDRNVRMEVIRLVTQVPVLLASDVIRKRLPDILLDRLSTGHAISEELNMARKIQLDLLPENPPRPERFDIEVFYRAAREVGGDYYDFFTLPGRNLGMAIADVAGKGIPAALTMAGLKGNLEAYVKSIYSISDIMKKVNESSVLGEGDPIMTGLFYGVLNLDSGILTYVNAGHNPPMLIGREGEVRKLSEGGLVLGLAPEAVYDHGSVEMESGDVLIMYTDGLTEAMDGRGREFGTERLAQVVLGNRDTSAGKIAGGILEAVNSFSRGSPQSDDQTLVVLKCR